ASAFLCPHLLEHAEPVQFRQLQVEQDDQRHGRAVASRMPAAAKQKLNGFHSIPDDDDFARGTAPAQAEQRQLLVIRVVFNEQDETLAHGPLSCPYLTSGLSSARRQYLPFGKA